MKGTEEAGYNNFDQAAQSVWAEADLAEKKRMVIDTMINQFKFKKKTDHFLEEVQIATSSRRIDKLVSDLALLYSGDRVIK